MAIQQPINVLPDVDNDTSLVGAYLNKDVAVGIDFSSNGYDGTVTKVATLKDGGGGFNGKDSIIAIANNTDYQGLFDGGATVEVWVKVNSDGEGNAGRILEKSTEYVFYVTAEAAGKMKVGFFKWFSGDDGTWETTATELTIGEWVRIQLTYDSSSVDNDPVIRINKTAVALTESGTPTGTADNNANNVYIGNNGASSAAFDGDMQMLNFYDEIKSANFDAFQYERSVPDDSLVLHVADDCDRDLSRFANTITPSGGAIIGDRIKLNGTTGRVDCGDIGNVQTIAFWVKPATTSEALFLIDTGKYIKVVSGTITYTLLTASATYVNGVASTTLAAGKWQHVMCVITQIDADNFEVGMNGVNYGEIEADDIRCFDAVKTLGDADTIYKTTRHKY